eukprot:267923_1
MSLADNKPKEDEKKEEVKQEEKAPNDSSANVINIIDTHIHLWDMNTTQREWQSSKGLESIQKTYTINDYTKLYENRNIKLMYGLFMETDPMDKCIDTEINEFTEACKDANNNVNGMIIKLDPEQPQSEFIKLINKYKQNKYIKGIRSVFVRPYLPNNDYKPTKQFIDNLKLIQDEKDINWTFDICANVNNLSYAEELLLALPNMVFILDHMGNGHEISEGNKELMNIWKQSIEKIAKYKHLNVKLSGLSGGQPGLKVAKKWNFNMETEKIDFLIKNFGEDRIVYGSDWPVSTIPMDDKDKPLFVEKWPGNLYHYLKQKYGEKLCNKLFVENPKRIYNL